MISPVVLQTLSIGFASVVFLFLIIWIVALLIKNASIVDIGWGIGFIILCMVFIARGQGLNQRSSLMLVMVLFWGLRIALFLIKRIIFEGTEDKRYQTIRKQWQNNIPLKFFFFFESQAVLQMIISVPFLIVSLDPRTGVSNLQIFAVVLFTLALLGEMIADEQLHAFKTKYANKGKTCMAGLWKYSRHPNYFFEWLIWVAFFLFALPSPWGWAAVLSPAIMYWLMMYVSGVPLAEAQALKTRGEEYRRYQQTTSVFFPLPKSRRKRQA